MQLTNEFTVRVPVAEAWEVLTDVERIAPCLPGAVLTSSDGDEHHGTVKVKLGPISAQYEGSATFEVADRAAGRIVLRAAGRDVRGQGTASALITAELVGVGDATTVRVLTDLDVTGKVAQFARGVIGEVSAKLLAEFADSLERTILATPGPSASPSSNGSEPAPPVVAPSPPSAAGSVDLLGAVGLPLLKRLAPVLVGLAVVAWLLRRRRRP